MYLFWIVEYIFNLFLVVAKWNKFQIIYKKIWEYFSIYKYQNISLFINEFHRISNKIITDFNLYIYIYI